jgi:hypothetical protein
MDTRRRNSTHRRPERPRPPRKAPFELHPSNDPAAAALRHEVTPHRSIDALRQIHHRLDVAQSVISLCAAVLETPESERSNCDVAAALKYSVGDVLDAQMESIQLLIKVGGKP